MNGIVQKTEYRVTSIVADPVRSIVLTKSFAENQGVLQAGTAVGQDESGAYVAFEYPQTALIGAGTGNQKNFTGAIGITHPGSLTITAGDITAADDGYGGIGGEGVSGTIVYTTGAISLSFDTAVTSGTEINASYGNRLSGVLTEDLDTSKTTLGNVLVFGLVAKSALVNPDDAERLEAIHIYAV
jgi:hypothetical protein